MPPGSGGDIRNVQVNLTANISPYQRAMQDAAATTSALSAGVVTLGRRVDNLVRSAGKKIAFVGAADIAGLTAAAEAANRLDVAMTQVRATSAITGQSVGALRTQVINLSRSIPDSTNNIARLVGQVQALGIQGTANITHFTETAERLAAATNTPPGQLFQGIVQLNRQMGSGLQTIDRYASTVVELAAKSGASANDITGFATAISSVAQSAGYTETQILGLAAAFSRAGADSNAAANVFTTITSQINEAVVTGSSELQRFGNIVGMTAQQFKVLAQSNPGRALTDILQAIHQQGQAGIVTLQQLGLDGPRSLRVIASLTGGQANLAQSMNLASDAYSKNTALTKASNSAWDDLSATMQKFRNNISDITTQLGGPMAHVLNIFFEGINGVLGPLNTFLGYLGPVPGIVAGIGGAFLAVTGTITAFSLAILAAAGAWRALSGMTGTNTLQGFVNGIRGTQNNPATIFRQRPIDMSGRSGPANRIFGASAALGARISAPPPEDPTLLQRAGARTGGVIRSLVTFPVRKVGYEAKEAVDTLRPGHLFNYENRDPEMVNRYSMLGMFQSLQNGTTTAARGVRNAGARLADLIPGGLGAGMASRLRIDADTTEAAAKVRTLREEASAPVSMRVNPSPQFMSDFVRNGPGAAGPGIASGLEDAAAMGGRTGGFLNLAMRGVGGAVNALGTMASAVSSVVFPLAILAPAGMLLYHVFSSLHNSAQDAANKMDDFGTELARTSGATYNKPSTTPQQAPPSDRVAPFGQQERITAASGSFLSGNASDIGRLRSYSGSSRSAAAQLMVQNVIANANNGQALSTSEQMTLREQLIAAYGTQQGQAVYNSLNLQGVNPATAATMQAHLLANTRNDSNIWQGAFQGAHSSQQIMNAVTPIANQMAGNPAQAALGLLGIQGSLRDVPNAAMDARLRTAAATPQSARFAQAYTNAHPDVQRLQQASSDIVTQLNKGQTGSNLIHIDSSAIFTVKDFISQLDNAGSRGRQLADNMREAGLNLDDLNGSVKTLTGSMHDSASMQQASRLAQTTVGRQSAAMGFDLSMPEDVDYSRNLAYLTNLNMGPKRDRAETPSPIDEHALQRAIDTWRQYQATLSASDPAFAGVSAAIDGLNQKLQAQQQIFMTSGQQASYFATQEQNMISQFGTGGQNGTTEQGLNDQAQASITQGEATLKGYVLQVHQAHIQMRQGEQDFNIQMGHLYRDFNIQQKEALYQRNLQVREANYEFGQQIRQMKFQTADAFGNPAQMVQSQYTQGAESALIGMRQQVQMLRDSKNTMDQLHQQGLSRGAIRLLGLDDPTNVEQAQRYMEDFAQNPKLIGAFNRSIKGRLKLSEGYDTDVNNSKFADMRRQFDHTATLAADAFNHSQTMTQQAFNRELSDFTQQYQISVQREMQQLNEIGQNLYTSWEQLDKAAMRTGLHNIEQYANGIDKAIGKVKRTTDNFQKSTSGAASGNRGSFIGIGGGAPSGAGTMGRFFWGIAQQEGNSYGAVNKSSGALGKYQVMPGNVAAWSREALGHSITPQEFLHSPQLQEKIVDHVLGGYFRKYGARGAASAWYSGNPRLANSTAPQYGGPSVKSYVDSVIALMERAPRPHHHSHHGGHRKTFAVGGIAMGPQDATVAEAGSPEAMIPLNQQGMTFMAQVMARYIQNTGISSTTHDMARSSAYASQVVYTGTVNNKIDNSTNFSGNWTLVAQDPDEMARKLQQRKRLSALSRPVARGVSA